MTPGKSIRKFCLECCDGQSNEVFLCPATDCVFYKFRSGRGRSKMKDIRAKCKDCGEGTAFAIKNCEIDNCAIYMYRLGHNPALVGKRRRNISDEQKKQAIKNLKKAREARNVKSETEVAS